MSSELQNILLFFAKIIEKETGILYTEANLHPLEARIRDVSRLLNFNDILHFWQEVETKGLSPAAKSLILDLATNNETTFFRDQEVFEFFKTVFVPKASPVGGVIRIWCAATSTGQEPYSLAMIMAQLKELGQGRNYHILATDISERVLKQARSGVYSQLEVQRGLPAPLLVKYFSQSQQEGSTLPVYKINAELSTHITFKTLNLLDSWGNHGPFDIVFCRNVLIYQSIENKKKVIATIANVLNKNGYLIMGGAESLLGLSDSYELKQFAKASVYQLKSKTSLAA